MKFFAYRYFFELLADGLWLSDNHTKPTPKQWVGLLLSHTLSIQRFIVATTITQSAICSTTSVCWPPNEAYHFQMPQKLEKLQFFFFYYKKPQNSPKKLTLQIAKPIINLDDSSPPPLPASPPSILTKPPESIDLNWNINWVRITFRNFFAN